MEKVVSEKTFDVQRSGSFDPAECFGGVRRAARTNVSMLNVSMLNVDMLHVNLPMRERGVAIVALGLAKAQKWAMEPWDTGYWHWRGQPMRQRDSERLGFRV